jgi:hypothetical protein
MMNLFITSNGLITAIYAEEINLQALGTTTFSRASHVEPDQSGQWFAEIVSGPKLGPFAKRSDALLAEMEWLTQHRLNPVQDFCEKPELPIEIQ